LIKTEYALFLAGSFAEAKTTIMKAKLITGRDEEFKETGVPLVKIR